MKQKLEGLITKHSTGFSMYQVGPGVTYQNSHRTFKGTTGEITRPDYLSESFPL